MGGLRKLIKDAVRENDSLFSLYENYSFSRHRKAIEAGAARGDLKIHLGCGPQILPDWINVDLYVDGDVLTSRLPNGLRRFPSSSTKFIYASHVVEHIGYPGEATTFAEECHRILVPGGAVRVIVPGIQKIIEAYVRDDAAFFEIQSTLHPDLCKTKLEHLMYALQQDGHHKYGYDFETMSRLFEKAGYSRVVKSDCNTSEFEELRMDYRATKDNHGNYLSLFVDAIK